MGWGIRWQNKSCLTARLTPLAARLVQQRERAQRERLARGHARDSRQDPQPASLPTHLYFWKQPLCEHLLSRSPFICASKGRVGERYASDVRRAQHAFTAFPRPQNYLYASSRRRRVNSSGLSVVYKLNFSSHDLQIVNESSVLLHTGDVLSEAF